MLTVQAALQAEKGSLQTRVAQLEKDLEAAKRTQSTSAGPSAEGASDNADLQAKHDLLAQQNEDLNKASLHDGRRRVSSTDRRRNTRKVS